MWARNDAVMNEQAANPYVRLKELLELKRAGRLTFEQSRELLSLHERASADLSLTSEVDAAEQASLKALVAESFNEVYGSLPFYRRPPLEFLRVFYNSTPQVLYKYRLYFWLILLVTLVSAAGGTLTVLSGDDHTPRLIFGTGMVEYFQGNVESDGRWALAADILAPARPAAGVSIMLNNIWVATISFLVGILLAYLTLIIIFYNGYLLGYVAALYVYTGVLMGRTELGWYFIAGVAPHGVLEIPAILLAATAGLAVGASWMFPGRRTRKAALTETTREVFLLVGAAALLLVVAGLIEAFITPLGGGIVVDRMFSTLNERMQICVGKIVFSVLLLAAFVQWLSGGWAEARRADLASREKG